MSLPDLPDEVLKSVMEYAGIHDAWSMTEVCCALRNVVNIPLLSATRKAHMSRFSNWDALRMADMFIKDFQHALKEMQAMADAAPADTKEPNQRLARYLDFDVEIIWWKRSLRYIATREWRLINRSKILYFMTEKLCLKVKKEVRIALYSLGRWKRDTKNKFQRTRALRGHFERDFELAKSAVQELVRFREIYDSFKVKPVPLDCFIDRTDYQAKDFILNALMGDQ